MYCRVSPENVPLSHKKLGLVPVKRYVSGVPKNISPLKMFHLLRTTRQKAFEDFCGILECFMGHPVSFHIFLGQEPTSFGTKTRFLGHHIRILSWELSFAKLSTFHFIVCPREKCFGTNTLFRDTQYSVILCN